MEMRGTLVYNSEYTEQIRWHALKEPLDKSK